MTKKILNRILNNICILNLFTIYTFSLIISLQLHAQGLSVNGKITSSRLPIRNAAVIYVVESDTTIKYYAETDNAGVYKIDIPTSVEPLEHSLPSSFELAQSYPNPFSNSTNIEYSLNKQSAVQMTVYDILGRLVRKFDVRQQAVGHHNVLWDGRNNFGQKVPTGVYFYRLNANGESQVKKMIFNQKGNGLVPLPHSFSPLHKSSSEIAYKTQVSEKVSYTVRIQNTSMTTPLVIPKEIENIIIQNDTTINFEVETRPVAIVNLDSLHQHISGFGAANILLWRPDMTDSEITKAFGTDDGQLGFSILRVMVEADSTRWGLYLPTAKKALEMGATITASPWHAPDRMSENIGIINRVRHDMYADYAAHLNSYTSFMKKNGVPVYSVSIQNEPDIEENWTSWTSDEIFTFMKDYAHAIEGTKVMAPESFHFDRTYSDPILNDSVACANTDIVCGHIYGSGLAYYPLAEKKGKEVWMTEHLSGEEGSANDWSLAFPVATEINKVMKANMSAYIWWYIVRFYGPISDGTTDRDRKGDVTKKGYIMSQFSRFIRPGFYRVESKVSPFNSKVGLTAYKDPLTSKVIIVAINPSAEPLELAFRIENGEAMTTFTPYFTTETKNCERDNNFTITSGNFTFTLEPSSIITFVSN